MTTEKSKKSLDFETRKPMDTIEDSVTSISKEQIVQCSGMYDFVFLKLYLLNQCSTA